MDNLVRNDIPFIDNHFYDLYYGTVPIILNFPHSGRLYPQKNLKLITPPSEQLRIFEDPFLDILLPNTQKTNTSVLINHYARAFIDVNRECLLDTTCPVFSGCPFVNSQKMGLIPVSLPCGNPLYGTHTLHDTHINERINTYYKPYHRALKHLIGYHKNLSKQIILLDCHSMPSHGGEADPDAFKARPDIIIGDNFGSSASEEIVCFIEQSFYDMGLSVFRNFPYSGGHIVCSYGAKSQYIHAVQIEINRKLYMDNHIFSLAAKAHEIAHKFQNMVQKLATKINNR